MARSRGLAAVRPSPAVASTAGTPRPPAVLGGLPTGLRQELVDELNKIERNYREGRWEPAELDGGRLSEIVYSIIRGYVDGVMPPRAYKPTDLVTACRDLENLPSATWPRSIRVQIPRLLLGLYEIRNNRSVGHVGGEVSPNHMDASLVHATAKWLVAELVRTFHQVDTVTATAFVDALVERDTPAVWVVGDNKRVLRTALPMRDKVLLLMHATATPVTDVVLRRWVEYSNLSVFRQKILEASHDEKLVEYNRRTGLVTLSPTGIRYVEANLPAWVA